MQPDQKNPFNTHPPPLTRRETTRPNQEQDTTPQNDPLYSQLLESVSFNPHNDTFISDQNISDQNISDQTQPSIYEMLQNIINSPIPGLVRQEGVILHRRTAITPQLPDIIREMRESSSAESDIIQETPERPSSESDTIGEDANTITDPISHPDQ